MAPDRSVAPTEHGAVAPARPITRTQTNTGVSNNKLAIWMFLASEALFFGAFLSTYFLYRGRDTQFLKGPTPHAAVQHPVHVGHAFVLLMSSLTMVLALDGDPARRSTGSSGCGSSRPRCSG